MNRLIFIPFLQKEVRTLNSIAHIRAKDGEQQTVWAHSKNVAKLSSRLGNKIGAKHLAFMCGLLHDIGKSSFEFRDYILAEVSNENSPSRRGTVDHSTAGGKMLFQDFHRKSEQIPRQLIVEILSNICLSHHTGLQDFLSLDATSNYLRRIHNKEITEFETIKNYFLHFWSPDYTENVLKYGENELNTILRKNNTPNSSTSPYLTISFLTKYLFSCLIDADRTDAMCFEENIPLITELADNTSLFEACYDLLINHLDSLNSGDDKLSNINRLRREMSNQCDLFADKETGIYSLSIPTGGGKTLSSLRYSLKHAFTYGKDRIIYVVPYTSIIEQNAQEVRNILSGYDIVLEHHSNVVYDLDVEDEDRVSYLDSKKYKLAKDNWDSPIIFTTLVQFLDVIYARGTRNIRRFHNLANSVIIFDEVQAVPIKCISLFNAALNFLKNVCNSSILLCTATQPALDFVEKSIDSIDGEIVRDLDGVIDSFKRVSIVDKVRPKGWNTKGISEFILNLINQEESILVILNTKTVTRKLYNELNNSINGLGINLYHLSTSMCAAHRKEVLKNVKDHLNKKERVICVSTQLIEAGVNISFDCVIRSLAGLDSIAQAAGRCNRHGKSEIKSVYVVNHNEEKLERLKTIKVGAEITERILIDKRNKQIKAELFSTEVMNLYFRSYYTELKHELFYDVPKVKENLYSLFQGSNLYKQYYKDKTGENFPLHLYSSMETVGEHFHVIDQNTISVLVPYGSGSELIADLNENISSTEMTLLLKKAQQFIVNIFEHEFKILNKNHDIIPMMDGKIFVLREQAYDQKFGICIEGQGQMNVQLY